MHRFALVVLLVLIIAQMSWAGAELKAVTLDLWVEENPAGCTTTYRGLFLDFKVEDWAVKLTDEAASDGYSRQSLYLGRWGEPAQLLVRMDELDRLWVGANYVQKLSDEFIVVWRPMYGAKGNTASRAYIIPIYQPTEHFGAMGVILAMEDYKTDYYVGPTYTNTGFTLFAGPILPGPKRWAVDCCYSIKF